VRERELPLSGGSPNKIAPRVNTGGVLFTLARDKASGQAKGVTVADVIAAVNDLFEENKGLEHAFALEEFKAEFMRDMQAKRKEILK